MRFSIVDFPVKPAKQKEQVALKKSLRLHTRGAPAAAAERVYSFFDFLFLQNSWSGPQAYLGADCRQKLPLDGAADFLAHYNSQFFVSFHFGFDQEAQKCL